jgi:hypothetical protein
VARTPKAKTSTATANGKSGKAGKTADLAEVKAAAAARWVAAVNADGGHGRWHYRQVRSIHQVRATLDAFVAGG